MPCTTVPLQVSRRATLPWTAGAHRSIQRGGRVLILAGGAAEGLEGLAVPSVPLDGGLDDLKADRGGQQVSVHACGGWTRACPPGRAPQSPRCPLTHGPTRQQKPGLRSGNVAQGAGPQPRWLRWPQDAARCPARPVHAVQAPSCESHGPSCPLPAVTPRQWGPAPWWGRLQALGVDLFTGGTNA